MFNTSFMNDMGNYEKRKVMRIEPNDNFGVGVSTAFTSDAGYETALLDENGVHPVERYKSKQDSKVGHKKWVEKSHELKTVTKLGMIGVSGDITIKLKRIK